MIRRASTLLSHTYAEVQRTRDRNATIRSLEEAKKLIDAAIVDLQTGEGPS